MEKQIELLGKYGVKNYIVKGGRIVINEGLFLYTLTSVPKYFLNGTIINGYLNLNSLTTASEGFLMNIKIHDILSLHSLVSVREGFLRGTTIIGNLYLRSLTEFPKDLFVDTIIKSKYLYLNAKMATKAIVKNIYKNSPNANIRFYC